MWAKGIANTEATPSHLLTKSIPSFTQVGAQGITAILYALFHGYGLLSSAESPYLVHRGHYRGMHGYTLFHDIDHLSLMIEQGVLNDLAPAFRPIFKDLVDPVQLKQADPAQVLQRKQDLFVIFVLLHEATEVLADLAGTTTFAERMEGFFKNEFFVPDTINMLNGLGFKIELPSKDCSNETMEACGQVVAKTVSQLWAGFLSRHGDQLRKTDFAKKYPAMLD